jgi:hypothetical protein
MLLKKYIKNISILREPTDSEKRSFSYALMIPPLKRNLWLKLCFPYDPSPLKY